MKLANYFIYSSCICFVLAVFVPYMRFDVYTTDSSDPIYATLERIKVNGIETPLALLTTVWLIFPLQYHFKKNSRSTVTILIICSSIVVIAQIVIYLLLTASSPSYYRGYMNVDPTYGYYLISFGGLLLLIGSILGIAHLHERKTKHHMDIIDSI